MLWYTHWLMRIDTNCVQLCRAYGFDCYDYQYTGLTAAIDGAVKMGLTTGNINSRDNHNSSSVTASVSYPVSPIGPGGVHVMEQVSTVKLFYLSKLIGRGVHVMLLDLDVGFLKDPALLYQK